VTSYSPFCKVRPLWNTVVFGKHALALMAKMAPSDAKNAPFHPLITPIHHLFIQHASKLETPRYQ
jgi:hypothetical protein